MEKVFLAFDTSNYTTSCAVCGENGEVLANIKQLLPVAKGRKGLRQSDALFHHTAALPSVMEEVRGVLDGREILAVGASERPRDAEGSYMPCFLAGVASAHSVSAALGVPYYGFSHQCGHIAAALYSSGREELFGRELVAFHVSGGTTDKLYVRPDSERLLKAERIGGTLDINAGQAIDRCGVMMGLDFPCGAELERLAPGAEQAVKPCKICVRGLEANLSGIENKVREAYDGTNAPEIARYTLTFVCDTLEALTAAVREKYANIPIIYAGGVMSCSIIKERLSKYGAFAEPKFSSDNAAGVSLLTRRAYLG